MHRNCDPVVKCKLTLIEVGVGFRISDQEPPIKQPVIIVRGFRMQGPALNYGTTIVKLKRIATRVKS